MKYFTLLFVFTLFSITVGFHLYPIRVSRHRRSVRSIEATVRNIYNNALATGQNLYRAAQNQASMARNLQRNQIQNPTIGVGTFYGQNVNPYVNGARSNFPQRTRGTIQGVSFSSGNGWQTVTLGYRYGPKVIISGPTRIIGGRIGINNIPLDPPTNRPNPIIRRPVNPGFGNMPINNLGPTIPIIPPENPRIPINSGGLVVGPQPIALGLTQKAPFDPVTDTSNDPLVFTRQSDKWFWGGNKQSGPLRGAVPPQNLDDN